MVQSDSMGSSSMRRALLGLGCLAASIACGALLTIGVAWGCLLWSPPVGARPKVQFVRGGYPITKAMSKYGEFDGYALYEQRGVGWTFDHAMASYRKYPPTSPKNKNNMTQVAAGWPWLCLEGERLTLASQETAWRIANVRSLPGADATRRAYIPLSPRWPAFIANTAVYAAVAFALVLALVIWKRSFRRWRGHCSRCGYQLRGLSPAQGRICCPECGKSVRQSGRIA